MYLEPAPPGFQQILLEIEDRLAERINGLKDIEKQALTGHLVDVLERNVGSPEHRDAGDHPPLEPLVNLGPAVLKRKHVLGVVDAPTSDEVAS